MTTTRKSLRFLTALALVFAMIFSIASVPVSAAGPETWYKNDGRVFENSFTIRGYNLTPVKTMGDSGTLDIAVDFLFAPYNTTPATLTVELRLANGTVLDRSVVYNETSYRTLFVSHYLNAGQQIQLYVSAYDANGSYMTPEIYYSHEIL